MANLSANLKNCRMETFRVERRAAHTRTHTGEGDDGVRLWDVDCLILLCERERGRVGFGARERRRQEKKESHFCRAIPLDLWASIAIPSHPTIIDLQPQGTLLSLLRQRDENQTQIAKVSEQFAQSLPFLGDGTPPPAVLTASGGRCRT